jgi:hypothetical protein
MTEAGSQALMAWDDLAPVGSSLAPGPGRRRIDARMLVGYVDPRAPRRAAVQDCELRSRPGIECDVPFNLAPPCLEGHARTHTPCRRTAATRSWPAETHRDINGDF